MRQREVDLMGSYLDERADEHDSQWGDMVSEGHDRVANHELARVPCKSVENEQIGRNALSESNLVMAVS